MFNFVGFFFFFQAEDGIRDVERSRGLGDVYKRQVSTQSTWGASSALGVFSEGGPYIVNNKTKELERNIYAWNEVADVLFIDQPVGVQFSFANDQSSMCKTEGCVADDLYTFLVAFYSRYPEYKKRNLYISGVSYGGHYVPAIAGKFQRKTMKILYLRESLLEMDMWMCIHRCLPILNSCSITGLLIGLTT
eukprot:TRINITY_DN4043_c0_g1_i4.p3 TRINITY_DN4043_c0_g1~~TRINITY_DN4043_c0_g1_i4.p3  ORF type:complete len:191 (+),score=41.52 TRINITY_DN4043_c0_g1_i4:35-607(+)